MAFNERYTDEGIAIRFLALSITIGWPLSSDLGWFGVWRLAGIGVAAVGVASFRAICEGVRWIIEWWTFRKL